MWESERHLFDTNKVLLTLCQLLLPQMMLFSAKTAIQIQIFRFIYKMNDLNNIIIT